MTLELICTGLAFPESPRWHDGAFWLSDFYTRRVHRLDLATGTLDTVAQVPGQPSGLGWLPDGRMLIVSMLDKRVLRQEPDGALVTHADLGALASFHCNDMWVDTEGRAYVGHFGFDLLAKAALQPASLILVTPEGAARTVATDMMFPNGTALTLDGGTLIVAETAANRLTAFDVADDGSLSRRRVWADLGAAAPDGICLDAQGAVWLASPRTRECLRVLEGGEVLERIATEDPAIACMLGGEDGRTLLLLTGHVAAAEPALARRSGRAWTVRVEVPTVRAG